MEIKSLRFFNGFEEFNRFTFFLEEMKWNIEKQLLKDRVTYYRSNKHFIELSEDFYRKKLSIWELKSEEVITWFDTMTLLRRMFIILFKKGIKTDHLKLFLEYPLIFGNHMRADYLIVYERLIVVLEFGMFNQDEKRSEERYTKKLQESINYRQLLANIVEPQIIVVNYVMIYRPEYDRSRDTFFKDNIDYNNDELIRLSNFLHLHFNNQNELSAFEQLRKIALNE
jgi:hypothetical protein